jgi:hypothetical protein
MEEQRMLENTVTELRFRYVQAFEASQSAKPEEASPGGQAESEGNA